VRNENSPLIKALQGRAKPKGDAPLPQFDAPRTFEIHHGEVAGLAGQKVGTPITVSLAGHIHSQNNDGHAVMHVDSVKPDSDGMTAKEHPDLKTPSKSGAVAKG
jgi:hypothetical protein